MTGDDRGDARSPSPAQTQPRRRTPLNSRACDRCRRRKAKCNAKGPREDRCSPCRDAGEPCTFLLPLARRGPKTRKRTESSGDPSALSRLSSSPGTHEAPLAFASPGGNPVPRLTFGSAATSPVSWDPTSLPVEHGLSPQTVLSAASDPAVSSTGALQRWQSLSRSLALANLEINRIVPRCLDLFFQYLYPLTPLVHEPSLRNDLAYFISRASSSNPDLEATTSTATSAPAGDSWYSGNRTISDPWLDSVFALITAVCAEAAFLLPKDLFPEGESVGDMLLAASRSCLNSYLEADLEAPSANSIAIRYFHSNCIHAAGKPKFSWHIFGEATRLAQVMQLHDESSLDGLLPIEAELRRRAFWIVYMGDKSAAILNNRPITIHRFSFESGITTAFPTGIEDEAQPPPPVGPSPPGATGAPSSPESVPWCFIDGFNANLRLWQAASDLLLEMRLLQDAAQRHHHAPTNSSSLSPSSISSIPVDQRQRLDGLYVHFITCLDSLPPYLQPHNLVASSAADQTQTPQRQFIIQCANLQVSLHCLRMVIAQKFDDVSYFGTSVAQAELRRTEIARDMLRVMHEAPFWSLQVNGEPYVEKIRLIGASLLAIIHRNPASPLAARARSDFTVLLDILTRLDSKASDALRSDSTWVGYGSKA